MDIDIIQGKFEEIFSSHPTDDNMDACLSKLRTPERLLEFLAIYIDFNSIFAGGVSALTAALHMRQDVFRDSSERIEGCQDKSAEIASRIFYAAEDEYCAHRSEERVTHRTLAQNCLRNAIDFFGCETSDIVLPACPISIKQKVADGYGFARILKDDELFASIGFHIASEHLADKEFHLLSHFLESVYPDFVRFLQDRKSSMTNAYFWIQEHCTVEFKHETFAIQALQLALEYYSGTLICSDLLKRSHDGYLQFVELQSQLFQFASESNST